MSERKYPLKEVLRITGLTHRALRYYVQLRLLPGAKPRGIATAYSHEQVLRLHAIRLMRSRDRLRLAAIRQRLGKMSVDELEAMLVAAKPPEPIAPPPSPSPPPEPIARPPEPTPPPSSFGTRWDHVELVPGLELRVRVDGGAIVHRLAQEIRERYGATPTAADP